VRLSRPEVDQGQGTYMSEMYSKCTTGAVIVLQGHSNCTSGLQVHLNCDKKAAPISKRLKRIPYVFKTSPPRRTTRLRRNAAYGRYLENFGVFEFFNQFGSGGLDAGLLHTWLSFEAVIIWLAI
jgi:hypothetical protein